MIVAPSFVAAAIAPRLCWVSDAASELWLPRFHACIEAWRAIEAASVEEGERSCALLTIPASRVRDLLLDCEARGMRALPVGLSDGTDAPLHAPEVFLTLCIARGETLDEAVEAFHRGDVLKLGMLLGYPPCCVEAFERGMLAVPGSENDSCSPEMNACLRPLGIAATSHLPCSWECGASMEHAERALALGRRLGRTAEMQHLLEMLDWPMSWSVVHGIAEVKTPVFKFRYGAAGLPRRARYVRASARSVERSGRGGAFPYQ